MIVVVKINKCLAAGGNVSACAYRAWRLSGLINNPTLRNRLKYLVAMNGYNVMGVFCIRAVARDPEPNRVQFDLTLVNQDCYNIIEDLINRLNQSTQKTRFIQGAGYIFDDHFRLAGISIPETHCCECDNIPLVESAEIEQKERPQVI